MKKDKKFKLIIVILIICLTSLGIYTILCTKKISTLNFDNSLLTKKIDLLENKITLLDEKIKKAENNKLTTNEESNKLKLPDKNIINKNNSICCSIYTGNIDTYNKEVLCNINLSKNNLEENLQEICNKLSSLSFNNLPINLIKIENIDNKKIAFINLSDLDNIKWSSNYFQGSAGGQITSISLLETILQKDLNSSWIDGVKFLYNNSPIEFEHTPKLLNINYR